MFGDFENWLYINTLQIFIYYKYYIILNKYSWKFPISTILSISGYFKQFQLNDVNQTRWPTLFDNLSASSPLPTEFFHFYGPKKRCLSKKKTCREWPEKPWFLVSIKSTEKQVVHLILQLYPCLVIFEGLPSKEKISLMGFQVNQILIQSFHDFLFQKFYSSPYWS